MLVIFLTRIAQCPHACDHARDVARHTRPCNTTPIERAHACVHTVSRWRWPPPSALHLPLESARARPHLRPCCAGAPVRTWPERGPRPASLVLLRSLALPLPRPPRPDKNAALVLAARPPLRRLPQRKPCARISYPCHTPINDASSAFNTHARTHTHTETNTHARTHARSKHARTGSEEKIHHPRRRRPAAGW